MLTVAKLILLFIADFSKNRNNAYLIYSFELELELVTTLTNLFHMFRDFSSIRFSSKLIKSDFIRKSCSC